MRLICNTCFKSVSNEVPEDTTVRAALVCPECIEAGRVIFPDEAGLPQAVKPEPMDRSRLLTLLKSNEPIWSDEPEGDKD